MRRGPAVMLLLLLLAAAGYGAQVALSEGWARVAAFSPPHFAAPRPGSGPPPLTDRLLLVMLDGLHPDDAALLPALDWLRRQGAGYRLSAVPPGFGAPAAASTLSGAPPELHGVLLAVPQHPLQADTLIAAAARAQLSTAAVGDSNLGTLLSASAGAWYTNGEPDEALRYALPLLAKGGPQVLVIQLNRLSRESRRTGLAGELTPEYVEALAALDGDLVRMLALVDLRKQTVIAVGTHPEPSRWAAASGGDVPLVMAGAGVRAGVGGRGSLLDLAPTAAALLGAPTPLQSQGEPLLAALDIGGRPADVIVQRALDGRRSFTEQVLLSLGFPTPLPEAPQSAAEADGYLRELENQLREARFTRWKEALLLRLPYLGGAGLLLLLHLTVLWWRPLGGLHFLGMLLYTLLFQAGFYLTGGRYSAAMGGLGRMSPELVAGLGLLSAASMALTCLVIGLLLSRRSLARRSHRTATALHLALGTAAAITLPVVIMLIFVGWDFPVALPATGHLIWFFITALQVVILGYMSPIWAGLTVGACGVAQRLWPLKEAGDPEQNADRVVRRRSLERTGARRR